MPFSISAKVFKQQSKTLTKHWPFSGAKTAHIRNVLSQVYGYNDSHHYQTLNSQTLNSQTTSHQLTQTPQSANTPTTTVTLTPISQATVIQHYTLWIQRLAKLAPMNEIQAKTLIHKIWSAYLHEVNHDEKLYQCQMRFYGDCNVFLDEEIRNTSITYRFDDKPSVKDTIEALGIPHPEILAIKVIDPANLQIRYVDFNHKLTDGCQISAYSMPDFLTLNTDENLLALPYKPKKLTFLLDVHLGGLARYLRMAGFDCLFETQDYGDALLAELANRDELILLTRDIGLLKRSKVNYGRWIRNVLPEAQFHEVINHYQLQDDFKPFSLCIKCNGEIKTVAKNKVADKVPKSVFEQLDDFKQCTQCQQIYWQGSHYDKIQLILQRAKALTKKAKS